MIKEEIGGGGRNRTGVGINNGQLLYALTWTPPTDGIPCLRSERSTTHCCQLHGTPNIILPYTS